MCLALNLVRFDEQGKTYKPWHSATEAYTTIITLAEGKNNIS
jgi:hypothetical protein